MPPRVSTILVPVDFSPGSEAAVEWAQTLAGAFSAMLILLHVVDTATSAVLGGPGAKTLIKEGAPRHEIVTAAKEFGADLIVMGTHGRTGLAHLLFGSVAEHVLRHAPAPVFTVRSLTS